MTAADSRVCNMRPARGERVRGRSRLWSHRLRSSANCGSNGSNRLKQEGWNQSCVTVCGAMRPEGFRMSVSPTFCMRYSNVRLSVAQVRP